MQRLNSASYARSAPFLPASPRRASSRYLGSGCWRWAPSRQRWPAARQARWAAVSSALIGAGIPEERARRYDRGIREGKIVLGVTPRSEEDAEYFEREWQSCRGEDIYRLSWREAAEARTTTALTPETTPPSGGAGDPHHP